MANAKRPALKLRVTGALARDVGRALARLGPEDMELLRVSAGDILDVAGKRRTVCRAMPACNEARGQSRIQLDGIARENAGAGIDESVTVGRASCRQAERIAIAPADITASDRDLSYIGRLLDGLPVMEGDRIRVTLFGGRSADFMVATAVPAGPVVINPATLLTIGNPLHERKGRSASYEDIGGLGPQLRRIREMIELPLRRPEVFQKLGIDAPRGVILHGPQGCGKTLIARAIAHETGANFFSVSGPEIIHKSCGESETHLCRIFEEAGRKTPGIIFLDEIDTVAPRRERAARDVEKHVLARLLALMDGLAERSKLIVIAATTLPHLLDQALRRPGRFDKEIAIPIPDRNGRLEIMEIHNRGMPLAEDVNMSHLAGITHGFVGADLGALCREAAMRSLRRLMPGIDFSRPFIPDARIARLEIRMADFLAALREVEPSAAGEVFAEVPNANWQDVGGLSRVKERLVEAVEWPRQYAHLFEQAGTRPPGGILLSGPPGCGKTLLAKAAATESGMNFISVKGPSLLSMGAGESERRVREVFQKARQASPCILFFDEIDAMVPARAGGAAGSGVAERVLSRFLTELDGIEELKGVLVLGATSRLDTLDPAVIRTGRFDEVIEIPLPDFNDRREIFGVHLREKPLARKIDFKELARKSEWLSGAEIESACNLAGLRAVRRAVEMLKAGQAAEVKVSVEEKDIEESLLEVSGADG